MLRKISLLILMSALGGGALSAQIAPGVGKYRPSSKPGSIANPVLVINNVPATHAGAPSAPTAPPPAISISTPDCETNCFLFEALQGQNSETRTLHIERAKGITGSYTLSVELQNTSGEFSLDKACNGSTVNGNITMDDSTPSCDVTIGFKGPTTPRVDAEIVINVKDATGTALPQATQSLVGLSYAKCTSFANYPNFAHITRENWFPLWQSKTATNENVINCFYNTASNLSAITQANYQYNPAGSASALTADLISAQFYGGFQITLGASAATSSCSSATASSSNPADNSCAGTAPTQSGVSQASLAQDVQQIQQGGDFGLKVYVPFFQYASKNLQISNFLAPKVGFTVSGLSSTVTAATGTAVNYYIPNETYMQFFSLPATPGGDPVASLFFDYRWGLESVDPAFALNAALQHHNFMLQQFSAGIVFNNTIKISGERYKGADQIYLNASGTAIPTNNFNNWILSVQFAPTPKQ